MDNLCVFGRVCIDGDTKVALQVQYLVLSKYVSQYFRVHLSKYYDRVSVRYT